VCEIGEDDRVARASPRTAPPQELAPNTIGVSFGRRRGSGRQEDRELTTESLALQLRAKRSEMMVSEVESVALRLFEARGFNEVTVEDIALEAHISVRTFYRYFPAKEDVLHARIVRRAEHIRAVLAARPGDEPPLHSVRVALTEDAAAQDPESMRRWIAVVATTPNVLKGVLGVIQLRANRVMADFFGERLGLPGDGLIPTVLAGAVAGVIQASQTQWFFHGGDLASTLSDGLAVLERGIGTDPRTWSSTSGRRTKRAR
jgi:AcrR family transcriptional regulator